MSITSILGGQQQQLREVAQSRVGSNVSFCHRIQIACKLSTQITPFGKNLNQTCRTSEFPRRRISSFSAEEVADMVVRLEKEKFEEIEDLKEKNSRFFLKIEGDPFSKLFERDDAYWKKQYNKYLKVEKWVRENEDKLPIWEVAGPLHYGMTLTKMQEVITKKFKEMVSCGSLKRHESITVDEYFSFYARSPRTENLTRIWGAEYLKKNLSDEDSFKVADHFLIIDPEATEIEVQVWHFDYPYLSRVSNGYIASKKVEGERDAGGYRFSPILDRLRYRDFGDSGNIIRDEKGIGWIVDTELKGFDAPPSNRTLYLLQTYLQERFKVLCGNDYDCLRQTFKISLSDIGL